MIKWTIGAIALMLVFCTFGGAFLLGNPAWWVNALIGFIGGVLFRSVLDIKD